MKLFAVIFLSVVLSSCASIPISTMLEFSSFDKQQLVEIQPQAIRAKLQVDLPVRVDVDSIELSLELTNEQGTRAFTFPLQLVSEVAIAPVEGMFTTTPGKTEYTLKLSEAAIKHFTATQQLIREDAIRGFDFSVKSSFGKLPSEVREIGMSIFLQLSEEKGFVTLFDHATLAIEHES